MQKIIAAFDGLKYSISTQQHAIAIAKKNKMHLVGVFLDDFTYHSYKVYDVVNSPDLLLEDALKDLNDKDEEVRKESVEKFTAACQDAGITYAMHRDRNIAIQELLHESIYSDLLVINGAETFTHYIKPMPTEFIRDILANVQCPVLVTTTVYKPFEKLVFLYDGEPASVHAIKMFDYLLSMYNNLPVEVVSVKSKKHSTHVPDNKLMKEFMKRHFPDAEYQVLKGDPDEVIVNHLADQHDNTLVVLGAYQRSTVSRWFKPSMADHLIKELRLPLFIAHK